MLPAYTTTLYITKLDGVAFYF